MIDFGYFQLFGQNSNVNISFNHSILDSEVQFFILKQITEKREQESGVAVVLF